MNVACVARFSYIQVSFLIDSEKTLTTEYTESILAIHMHQQIYLKRVFTGLHDSRSSR